MASTSTWSDINREFGEGFNKAAELFCQDDKLEKCKDILLALLAKPHIPRFYEMRCYILLSGVVSDWEAAYGCYKMAATIWHVTAGRNQNDETPLDSEVENDLQNGLLEVKLSLLEDEEGCHESLQDPEKEAELLQSLREPDTWSHWACVLAEPESYPKSSNEHNKEDRFNDEDEPNNMTKTSDDDETSAAQGDKEGKIDGGMAWFMSMGYDPQSCDQCGENFFDKAALRTHQTHCVPYQVKITREKVEAEMREKMKIELREMREKMESEMEEMRNKMLQGGEGQRSMV